MKPHFPSSSHRHAGLQHQARLVGMLRLGPQARPFHTVFQACLGQFCASCQARWVCAGKVVRSIPLCHPQSAPVACLLSAPPHSSPLSIAFGCFPCACQPIEVEKTAVGQKSRVQGTLCWPRGFVSNLPLLWGQLSENPHGGARFVSRLGTLPFFGAQAKLHGQNRPVPSVQG